MYVHVTIVLQLGTFHRRCDDLHESCFFRSGVNCFEWMEIRGRRRTGTGKKNRSQEGTKSRCRGNRNTFHDTQVLYGTRKFSRQRSGARRAGSHLNILHAAAMPEVSRMPACRCIKFHVTSSNILGTKTRVNRRTNKDGRSRWNLLEGGDKKESNSERK